MKKSIFLLSVILFILPVTTLLICHQLHVAHTGFQTIPFIDGKVSVSLIGRQTYSIGFFKPSFFLYSILSIFFYFKISNLCFQNNIKNKLKILGVSANFFLCVYIFALGKNDPSFYAGLRRLSVILYITNIYFNHIYLVKILKSLKFKKIIRFNSIFQLIFYTIISIMTILIIIGLPWVNPLFKYPDQLKNIIEWNYFLLTIVFYIPLSILFYNLSDKLKK